MLTAQFVVELILKSLDSFCFIVASSYRSCLSLFSGCAELDEMLDVIVVDVI